MKFQGTTAELTWLAGLLEGEGCFFIDRGKYARMTLKMTDRDVVYRAYRTTGVGTFTESHPPRDQRTGRQPTFVWRVSRKDDVLSLMEDLQPLMGARRANKIQEILKFNDDVEGTYLV